MTDHQPPLTVCLCVADWPSLSKMNGAGRYAQTLARCMAARGIHVHVLTPVSTPRADFMEDGYWVHPRVVRPWRVVSRFQPGIGESWQLWRALETLRKSCRIDIVEFANWEGIGAVTSLLSSLPAVIRVHTTAYESLSLGIGHQRLERGYARLERLTAHHADGLVTNSIAHRDQAASNYDLRPEQITVAELGLEDGMVREPVTRNPRQILAVGAASPRKGVDFFLEVGARLARKGVDGEFVWVGRDSRSAPGGLLWSEYADRVYPQLKSVVRFECEVSDEQLADFYAQSAVYFGSARYESFGLTLVEAMQRATPVVAPDTGSMADIVGDNLAGLLYVPQDVESAAAQLKRLLTEPELARRLGEQGRQRARTEYSAEAMTDRVLAFYEKVIGQRGRGQAGSVERRVPRGERGGRAGSWERG